MPTALPLLLTAIPGLAFETWGMADGRRVIDLLRVPETSRRRGIGAMVYRSWEAALPAGTRVELVAIDDAAEAFWRSVGFDMDEDGRMRRTVPGTMDYGGERDMTDDGPHAERA